MEGHPILTFASAECFTHCEIGMKTHLLSAPYRKNRLPISVKTVLFLPSRESVKTFLEVSLPKPDYEVEGIKIYKETENEEVVSLLVKELKKKTGADICISSSAGTGKGIVAILFKNKIHILKTVMEIKDFKKTTTQEVKKRKEEAVEKTLNFIEKLLEEHFYG